MFDVGDIVIYQWNVPSNDIDFYQVVKKKRQTVFDCD